MTRVVCGKGVNESWEDPRKALLIFCSLRSISELRCRSDAVVAWAGVAGGEPVFATCASPHPSARDPSLSHSYR